jgi:hypothetical protein
MGLIMAKCKTCDRMVEHLLKIGNKEKLLRRKHCLTCVPFNSTKISKGGTE